MSSSASDSSGAVPSTSSGRTTPDAGLHQRSGSPASTAFGNPAFGQHPSRRSSTPAHSFLPPRFWQAQHQHQHQHQQHFGQGQGQAQPYGDHGTGSGSGFSMIPRRTSFGTALGGGNRLTALSAFGMGPSTPIHQPKPAAQEQQPPQPPSQQQQQQQQHNQHDLVAPQRPFAGAGLRMPSDSALSTNSPDATPLPSAPSSPVAKPQKQRSVCYLPGPDGLLVESRSRRRSEA